MQSHKKTDTSTAPDKIPLETKVSQESSSGKTLLDSEKAPVSSPPLRRSRRTQSSPKQAITTPNILLDNLAKALIVNNEEIEVGTVVEERDTSKSAITTPKISSDNPAKALNANSEEFEVGTVVEERDTSKSDSDTENSLELVRFSNIVEKPCLTATPVTEVTKDVRAKP